MNNKLQNLHLKAIDKINTFSPYDTNRDCQIAKMNNEIANKCSNITEDISIKFAEWLSDKNWFVYLELNGVTYWDNHIKIKLNDKYPTTKELFNKFIETL